MYLIIFYFFILALKESEKTDRFSLDDMIPSIIQLKISIWNNLIWMREIIICDVFDKFNFNFF